MHPHLTGVSKKNASFLNKGTNAPAFNGGAKKNASFLNKGTNGGANKNAQGPKKGMFNFFKRGATSGAVAGPGLVLVRSRERVQEMWNV